MLFFILLIFVTWISNRWIYCFPKFLSKLVVWYGLAAIGDPFLTAVVDVSLRIDDGDIFKLYNYYQDADGTGFAGIIIVLIIYGFMFLLSLVIFYNYIIFHHNNGRLQDIYVRMIGHPKVFFIPSDNELSLKHLLWAYFTGIKHSFRIVCNKFSSQDENGKSRWVSLLQLSQYDTKTSLKHWRSFLKDY